MALVFRDIGCLDFVDFHPVYAILNLGHITSPISYGHGR